MGIGATNSLNWLPCPQFRGSCSAVKDDTPLAMSLTAKQEVLRWLNYWLAFGSNFHWHLRRFPNFIQNRRLAVPIPLFLLLYRFSTQFSEINSQKYDTIVQIGDHSSTAHLAECHPLYFSQMCRHTNMRQPHTFAECTTVSNVPIPARFMQNPQSFLR